MEKILIIGLLTIAGVITALILFMGSQSSIQEASDQNREKQSQAGLKAQTIIEILNVRTGDNGSALDVWVKNRGVAGISTQDIENLEVFLMDVQGNWGDYIAYSPIGPVLGENTWSWVEPIDRTWGSGDTLRMSIFLGANPVSALGYNISVNTPSNATARYRFDGDPTSIRPPTPTPIPAPAVVPGVPPIQPTQQPATATCDGQIQTIFKEREVSGELTNIGDTVTYVFCGSAGTAANIYMWTPGIVRTNGTVLDTLIRIQEPDGREQSNDDRNWEVMRAFNSGELSAEPIGPYNSAIMAYNFNETGAYKVIADSYRNRGIGDYLLKMVTP